MLRRFLSYMPNAYKHKHGTHKQPTKQTKKQKNTRIISLCEKHKIIQVIIYYFTVKSNTLNLLT